MSVEDFTYMVAYWGGAWAIAAVVAALAFFAVANGGVYLYEFFATLLRARKEPLASGRKHVRRGTDRSSLRRFKAPRKRIRLPKESEMRVRAKRRLLHRKVI